MQETIQALLNQFFTWLGITVQNLTLVIDGDDYNIRVETPDSALLIWMHGKNMDSFQHLLSRMVENIVKSYVHVHLEVNDYMKAKDERLFRFLDSKIAFVMSTGKTTRIPNLTSYERKKAHNYIATREIEGLSTHSDWEGTERSLFLDFKGPLVALPSTPSVAPSTNSSPSKSTTPSQVDLLSEDWVGI